MKKWLKARLKKLKSLQEKLTNPFWRAKSRYIRYYDQLPLDECGILLESEHGKKVDGNIFYLLRYLANSEQYAQYRIYLSAVGRNKNRFKRFLSDHGIENVHVVVVASDEYVRLLAGVKYLINDTTFAPYFVKKEGQVYLNTWHGTPLKALGKSDKSELYKIGNVQKNFVCSDFLLFPNEYTKECLVKDYMLEDISSGQMIYGGYPRNEAFFDLEGREALKEKLALADKHVYAYMPTYRSSVDKKGYASKDDVYLLFFLYELDKRLGDDEILFTNLHPLARSKVNFDQFKHIRPFPPKYEVYEFLNTADVLITDYSSVFFDFACSGKKIVLFPYDKEEYLRDRGMYFDMDELPFPQVETVQELLLELREPKRYSDKEFVRRFCPWDGPDTSQKLCDYVILGQDTKLKAQQIPRNGKENVLIYAGNLASNGITTSLRSLLSLIDIKKRNYYIAFTSDSVVNKAAALATFPEEVRYYPCSGDMNLTVRDRVIRKLFKMKVLPASCYMKLIGNRVRQELKRKYGTAKLDAVIQFNGYENEVILCLSAFEGTKAIFVHSDMLAEMKVRKNQRKDVLRYAYQHYNKVAVVTDGILASTQKIAGKSDNIRIVKNAIQYQSILERAQEEITLDDFTRCSIEREAFFDLMATPYPKFVCVGRFSPEKGHRRLVDAFRVQMANMPDAKLIIMGGSTYANTYNELQKYVLELGLEQSVILLCRVSNPYPIIKACNYSILSSFYEGFGLVLVEADILGKPVVSTDIPGPRDFMLAHGGTLVENSQTGLEQGFRMLYNGTVQPMTVDYEDYNKRVIDAFEELLL